jgi:branched-chain amino acid transport system permease protein
MLYGVLRGEVLEIPSRIILWAFILFLFLFPLVNKNTYVLRILNITAIFAIYACSWDLLGGFVGQINLGQALFLGVGAYLAALLNLHLSLPFWITVPISGIGAVIVGLIACAPTLRLRGFYLALVTLTFPIILTGLVNTFPDLTGGELGLYGIDSISDSENFKFYLIHLIMVCSIYIMYKFSDPESKFVRVGVVLCGIREDEIAARVSGISTTKYKLGIFAMSGFFSGIAGALYAHLVNAAGPSNLELLFSILPILWTVFGGIGTIYGPVAGVYILYPLLQFIRNYSVGEKYHGVMLAAILIVVLLFMPEGITVWIRDKIEIRCPRCKIVNAISRRLCRSCRAQLHLEANELRHEI